MPQVSVIIPNYNHADFLRQRIESVLAQTFTDYELIILDDYSPDNSREVIAEYASKHPQIKTVFNEQNSGSPFAQWNKGCELAKGEYLWFAESDDFCEPKLLETLVPLLNKNANVGIAYAQTYLVDEKGAVKNSYLKNLDFIYKNDTWHTHFIKNGAEACKEWLLFHNPIPNASGALIRKRNFVEAGMGDASMKLNGDWFLYAKILAESDLAFSNEHLNYFRVHDRTQRQRAKVDGTVYLEIIRINDFIREHIKDSKTNADLALRKIADWWIGSIPRQKWTVGNFQINRQLYGVFKKYRGWVLFHICYTYILLTARKVLYHLGLLKVAKTARFKMFPGKYFTH